MKPKCLILVAGITAALNCSAFGQQDEKLGKLVNLAKNADTERPETREARAFPAGAR